MNTLETKSETENQEIWKNVPGYENYQVSNYGNVKKINCSINDFMNFKNGVTVKRTRKYKEKELKKIKNGDGYYVVGLPNKKFKVHRLVLTAFVGMPMSRLDACHNNGVKTDNRLDNLRWDTRSGNFKDKLKHGTALTCEKHYGHKLTWNDVDEIRFLKKRYNLSYKMLANMFGVHVGTIYPIIKNITWKEERKECYGI